VSEARYRLTRSAHGSWAIQVRYWVFWFTIDIRTPLDRAVRRLREIAGDDI
jgi:hypothetical protein